MTKSDPFGFDMSVSTAKKKNPRGRRGMSGASETSVRQCEHPGCEEAGKFRAPKAPDVLDDYFWFCQQHVREYNLKWNFFDGTTEAELNAQMSNDKVWERPTKPLGDPEARAYLESLERLNDRLREAFEPVAEQPIPETMTVLLRSMPSSAKTDCTALRMA